jgi:hypothetical protein
MRGQRAARTNSNARVDSLEGGTLAAAPSYAWSDRKECTYPAAASFWMTVFAIVLAVGDESTSVGLGLPITSFGGREKQWTGMYSGKRGRVREGVRDAGRRKLSAWWGRALLFSGTRLDKY